MPDLSGRCVLGASERYSFGEQGGSNTVTLTEHDLPVHSHLLFASESGYLINSSSLFC